MIMEAISKTSELDMCAIDADPDVFIIKIMFGRDPFKFEASETTINKGKINNIIKQIFMW